MPKYLARFEGAAIEVEATLVGRALLIASSQPLRVLSSAVLNGGPRRARYIINYQVPRNYRAKNPRRTLIRVARQLGIPAKETVGLMTAAKMRNAAVQVFKDGEVEVLLAVTAGVSNAIAVGDPPSRAAGTINVIAIINADLSYPCLVEAAKTITEGKADAMRLLDVRSVSSHLPAVGTSTDSLVVACTGRGLKMRYAGLATPLGSLLGSAVRDLILQAVEKQDGLSWSRDVEKRLLERGIHLGELLRRAVAALTAATSSTELEELERLALRLLKRQPVSSLVAAALRADDDPLASSSQEAMELVGKAIAEHLSGSRGSEALRGVSSQLHPTTYAEWAVAGLLAASLSSRL